MGGIFLLNDPVEKVGVSGKLKRVWCVPYQITWLFSHNCRLVHTLTGKVINGLVHIKRIKPYYYRDELPDELEEVLDGNEVWLNEAQVPRKVVNGASVPKVVKTKTVKKPKSSSKPVSGEAPDKESTQGE